MSISSSGIFHFTGTFESLFSIIRSKFNGSRCKELLTHGGETLTLFVPMISFCDIQLSQYLKMGSIYGRYGLGMNRQWAIRNKLNPVLYIDKNSNLIDNFMKSLRASETTVHLASEILNKNQNKNGVQITRNLNDSVGYLLYSLYHTKHYEDDLIRKEETIKDYRFYDEREWRYIPDFDCAICQLKIDEEEYYKWRGNEDQPKPMLEEVELKFNAGDIDFVIVDKESDVDSAIEEINKLTEDFFVGYSQEKFKMKIISFEKIEKNI